MGRFAGLGDAPTSANGNFLDVGLHDIEITKTLVKDTIKNGDAWIVEMTVLKSTSPKHAPGTKATWYQGMKNKMVYQGEVKKFLLACAGVKADDAKGINAIKDSLEEMAVEATDEEKNSLKGTKLRVEVFLKPLANDKTKNFSVHVFSPAKDAPPIKAAA